MHTFAAGAISDGGTIHRGLAAGVSFEQALEHCDSYTYFDLEGGLLRTGLTGTNVMDIHVVLCHGSMHP
jgi:glycerate 2-kinase